MLHYFRLLKDMYVTLEITYKSGVKAGPGTKRIIANSQICLFYNGLAKICPAFLTADKRGFNPAKQRYSKVFIGDFFRWYRFGDPPSEYC